MQLLYKYGCTYNNAETILAIVINTIKQQREELEYNSIDDFINENKTHVADNDIVKQLNHVDGLC